MTIETTLVLVSALLYGSLFRWAFRVLPTERWQFIASVPRVKLSDGRWIGTNLTYYGAFTAGSVVLAVVVVIVLLGAVGTPLSSILWLSAAVLATCVPSAKWLARVIEGKAHTFTIGGASMFGLALLPGLVWAMNLVLQAVGDAPLSVTAVMAVAVIAYAFGEGTGRLACLSFGCCYGAPLRVSPPWVVRLFARHHTAFVGRTKKAAYESGLESVPLVPIQAVTAALSVTAGTVGLWMFLQGCMVAAFVTTVCVTQLWRVASEYLRADYRGGGTISSYQWLSMAGVLYALLSALWLPDPPIASPHLLLGLALLWQPATILFLQALWLGLFLFTGRSRVTMSMLSMQVIQDRI